MFQKLGYGALLIIMSLCCALFSKFMFLDICSLVLYLIYSLSS